MKRKHSRLLYIGFMWACVIILFFYFYTIAHSAYIQPVITYTTSGTCISWNIESFSGMGSIAKLREETDEIGHIHYIDTAKGTYCDNKSDIFYQANPNDKYKIQVFWQFSNTEMRIEETDWFNLHSTYLPMVVQ